jgi:hypothetical protein
MAGISYQFEKHYSREEARALLPQIREWLRQLDELRPRLLKCEERLGPLMESGIDAGGKSVNAWVSVLAGVRAVLIEFQRREIVVKDLDRGLVDFPAIIGGREVFLCWEKGEEDIEFWHELETGYAGRERL